MTGVKFVRLDQTEIYTEQIGHGAAAEPLAVQLPLATRRDQPIRQQNLQDLIPPRALAIDRQTLGPEAIQLQLLPQLPGQPARTHCRGRHSRISDRRSCTVELSGVAAVQRSSGNSAASADARRSRRKPRWTCATPP